MNDNIAHITKTVEDLKEQLATKLSEVSKIIATMNVLEEMIGAPKTLLPTTAPLQLTYGSETSMGANGSRNSPSLRPDEFMGEEPLEAAKKYMKRIGHAVHIDEIADAITRGGAAIKGSDWRDRLETSLIRSVAEVVKVQSKTFGLTEFYTPEQIRGLRSTRKQATPANRKGNKRGRPRKSEAAKKAKQATATTPKVNGENEPSVRVS